jgi:hypothetical protein
MDKEDVVYIQMERYSAINESDGTKINMFTQISQAQKDNYPTFPLICGT